MMLMVAMLVLNVQISLAWLGAPDQIFLYSERAG
jgi:hypothetical protein